MIFYNDEKMLQEAYLSVAKGKPYIPLNKETVSTDPNKIVSAGPLKEPAPGIKVDWHEEACDTCEQEECECHNEEHFDDERHDTTGIPVVISTTDKHGHHSEEGDARFSADDEDEEDDIVVDNLHSIKESLLKISLAVRMGVHLEPWQQSKLTVVMDNLASIARSIPRQSNPI